MALYAIGDVQGCFAELRLLLDKIRFDPAQDRLWLTGDLVNRGPQSLETVRFVKGLGDAAVSVLGNHDLHLLAVAYGISRTKHKDTFGDILNAPDRDELLDWLRNLPLLHHDYGFYLIHAGLPPQWDMATAEVCAREVETVLRGEDPATFFRHMYGDQPPTWTEELAGWDRLRYITNAFTRIRYIYRDGRVDFHAKCAPGQQDPDLLPWFEFPGRRFAGAGVVFGHWSTLGFYVGNGCYGLDTGCLWGGELTALQLMPKFEKLSVDSLAGGYQKPG